MIRKILLNLSSHEQAGQGHTDALTDTSSLDEMSCISMPSVQADDMPVVGNALE